MSSHYRSATSGNRQRGLGTTYILPPTETPFVIIRLGPSAGRRLMALESALNRTHCTCDRSANCSWMDGVDPYPRSGSTGNPSTAALGDQLDASSQTAPECRCRLQVRTRLAAGGRWIRTSGSAPAATPLTDRGVKPQATAAGCHFGGTTPVASAVNVNLLRRVALHEKLTQKHDSICGVKHSKIVENSWPSDH